MTVHSAHMRALFTFFVLVWIHFNCIIWSITAMHYINEGVRSGVNFFKLSSERQLNILKDHQWKIYCWSIRHFSFVCLVDETFRRGWHSKGASSQLIVFWVIYNVRHCKINFGSVKAIMNLSLGYLFVETHCLSHCCCHGRSTRRKLFPGRIGNDIFMSRLLSSIERAKFPSLQKYG